MSERKVNSELRYRMNGRLSGDHVSFPTPARFSTRSLVPSQAMVISRPSKRRGQSPSQFVDVKAEVDSSSDDETDSDSPASGKLHR